MVACATVNASRVFPLFNDRGTLNVGAPADVAVLELREGTFEFVDNYENKRTGRQRLFPSGTVLGGPAGPWEDVRSRQRPLAHEALEATAACRAPDEVLHHLQVLPRQRQEELLQGEFIGVDLQRGVLLSESKV